MATWLKQSTAIEIPMGPFVDSLDGNTIESGLTITQPDIRLKKNGAAWAQKNAAQTLTHEEAGWYEVALDATDTNTLGHLLVAIHETGALPVWREFLVVPADVYDAFVSGTGNGIRADLRTWLGIAPNALSAGYVNTLDLYMQRQVLNVGTAQGGTANTITLQADASSVDNYLNAAMVVPATGTGAGQARRIISYNGTTKVATVDRPWLTIPDSATGYTVYAMTAVGVGFLKNVAFNNFQFMMIDSTDHVSGKASLSVTAERLIDDGTFAACANAVVEEANGLYRTNLAAADLNGDIITFKFTAAGADPTFVTIRTSM